MIMLSEIKSQDKKKEFHDNEKGDSENAASEGSIWEVSGSTVLPWWARTNSHGRRRRRRKVPLFLSNLF
jgi:hypothetical protein